MLTLVVYNKSNTNNSNITKEIDDMYYLSLGERLVTKRTSSTKWGGVSSSSIKRLSR